MSTISASTGQILSDDGTPNVSGAPQNPYNTYVSNMSNLLSYITKTSSAGNAGMLANNEGLQRGQAALATPDSAGNPLNGLYSFMPGSARTGVEATMGDIMKPAILSNAGQAASANQTASSLQSTVNDQLQGATAEQNAGIGKYTQMFNPVTGQLDAFNNATGQWASASQGGGQGSTPLAPGQTDWAAYNGGDDPDYTRKMDTATSTIQQQMPTFDPTTADQYIKMHSPKSPISGQMILQAANAYGVNPTKLMAQVGLESVFGTSGVAQEDNNPGGIKFAHQNGAIQGTMVTDGTGGFYASFDNLQDGLYAQAKLIAGYTGGNPLNKSSGGNVSQVTTQTSPSGAPVAPSGTQAQTIYHSANINSRPALGFTSTGMLYMDSSKIPSPSTNNPGSTIDANNFASKNNIPILDSSQIAIIKGADEAINNITKVVAPAWEKVAPGNSLDALLGSAEHPLSSLFNTDWAANVKTFKANTENIAQQIKALSQSAPKLGLIDTAEAALPVLNYNFIGGANPNNFDTMKAGETKMQRTLDLLGQTVAELVPGYQPPTLPFSTSAGSSNGNTGVTSSGIQYTVTH